MGVLDILRAAGRGLETDRNAVATIIGPRAKNFDWESLVTAMNAERQGASRDEIMRLVPTPTMRLPAPSSAWVQEVPNNTATTDFAQLDNLDPRQVHWRPWRDLIDDPATSENYPSLFDNLLVKVEPSRSNWGVTIPDFRQGTRIEMSSALAKDGNYHPVWTGKRVLLHEGDHIIQVAEGFPRGDNVGNMDSRVAQAKLNLAMANAAARASDMVRAGGAPNIGRALDRMGVPAQDIVAIESYLLKNGDDSVDDWLRAARDDRFATPGLTGTDWYYRSFGEAMARTTGEGANLSMLERQLETPFDRMPYLQMGPVTEDMLWQSNHAPHGQRDVFARRAQRDDAIGRALADLIRAGVAGGGALTALSMARSYRDQEGRHAL